MSTELDARRLHTIRRTGCAAALLSVLALLVGCDPATTPSASGSDRIDTSSATQAQLRSRPADESDESLIAQAQRDVEFFLSQRESPDEKASGQESSTDAGTDQQRPRSSSALASTGPAAIQWNDPVGAGAVRRAVNRGEAIDTASRKPSSPTAQGNATADAVAADDEPVITQQPLYRDDPQQTVKSGRDDDASSLTGDPLRVDRARKLVVDLSGELYRRAERSDAPLRELMLIAATSIVSPDRSIDSRGIASLSERDRELLAEMQSFFATLGSELPSADDAEGVLRSAVADLQQALDRKPPFIMADATLCTRVRGFGDYDMFDRLSFLAHKQQKVIVYVELENFTSTLNQQQQWVTELAQELVIYSAHDGLPVWSEAWQSVVDVTRNKRQDFFTVQLVTLPEALSVGRYHLKVRMRDEATGAMAERSIAFEMVADPRMAVQVQ